MAKLETLEHYKIIREKWTHEDHLINYRISWLLVSQALFFAAYGVFFALSPDPKWAHKVEKIMIFIPVLGIIITILAGLSIFAAIAAQRSLSKYSFKCSELDTPFGINTYAPVDMIGHSSAGIFPIIFLTAWVFILAS